MEPHWTAERVSCRANKPTATKCPGTTRLKILLFRIPQADSCTLFLREHVQ